MKTILILGGNGFLGKNLNEVFKNSKYKIYNESRSTGCDILNINLLSNKIRETNPDVIINAAAHVGSIAYVSKHPAQVCSDNTLIYLNIFKAIKNNNPKILLINPISNCSYPGIIDVQHEEMWWNGNIHESVESYGAPKKLGFILSECYRKQFGINTVNLILPNAYGPFDYLEEEKTHAMNGIIMRMIKAVNNNEKEFLVWGSGRPIREWIYMKDAARVIKEVIEKKIKNIPNPLNIGQEIGVSINDSVNQIKKELNTEIAIINDLTKQDGAPIKILGKKKFQIFFLNSILLHMKKV